MQLSSYMIISKPEPLRTSLEAAFCYLFIISEFWTPSNGDRSLGFFSPISPSTPSLLFRSLRSPMFFFFFNILFIYFRESVGERRGWAEREGETESQAGSSLNMEPDARALYQDPEIVTWDKFKIWTSQWLTHSSALWDYLLNKSSYPNLFVRVYFGRKWT